MQSGRSTRHAEENGLVVMSVPAVETAGYFLSPRRGFGLRKRIRMSFRFSSAKSASFAAGKKGNFRNRFLTKSGSSKPSLPQSKKKRAADSALQLRRQECRRSLAARGVMVRC
jgi:hypothetical protein